MVCRVVRRRRQVEKILLGVGKKSIIYDRVKVGDDSPQKVYKNSKKYAGRWKKMAID